MATSGKAAFGTLLAKGASTIAEIVNISGPTLSLDALDMTNHQSPDGFKEVVAGLGDGGEVTLEGNWITGDTNGQKAMMQALTGRSAPAAYTLTFPGSYAVTFNAITTRFQPSAPSAGKLGFSATLKVSGLPVFP